MERKIYIANEIISLAEYIPNDNFDRYNAWKDADTEKAYNSRFLDSFEEFCKWEMKQRFNATVIRNRDNTAIGIVMLSPEDSLPDLAIIIYKHYRNQGYGTNAFGLGIKYCFDILKTETLYAGCYTDNIASLKMLHKCGFIPHPAGNQTEKHYITGKEITQLDFMKTKPDHV